MQTLRYLGLALGLGALSVWGSENLFWIIPPPGLTPLDFALTILAYAVACAVALSAVIWTGVRGMPAAFLGGAIMGYMAEGVIVGTVYQIDAFPFYLIWTPLAWHALVTGALILGVGRACARLGPVRMGLVWAALGLVGAYWGQYWPSEQGQLPQFGAFAVYILGLGLFVPLVHVGMDRIGEMPRPHSAVLWGAPVFAALIWGAQTVAERDPYRFVIWVILGVVVWGMWRLGDRDRPVTFGPPVPVWWHALFLIAPLIVVLLAPLGWAQGWGTLGSNWVVAGITSLFALGWLGRLVWRAAMRA